MSENLIIYGMYVWVAIIYVWIMFRTFKWFKKTLKERKNKDNKYYEKLALIISILPSVLIGGLIVGILMYLLTLIVGDKCDEQVSCKFLVEASIIGIVAIFVTVTGLVHKYVSKRLGNPKTNT